VSAAPSGCPTCADYALDLADLFSDGDDLGYRTLQTELAEHKKTAHPNWTAKPAKPAGYDDDAPGNAFSWRGRLF
jgi:hypothetical protein